jgi:protein-S-isoprenylcysteine O-methyltransferase Ste14
MTFELNLRLKRLLLQRLVGPKIAALGFLVAAFGAATALLGNAIRGSPELPGQFIAGELILVAGWFLFVLGWLLAVLALPLWLVSIRLRNSGEPRTLR